MSGEVSNASQESSSDDLMNKTVPNHSVPQTNDGSISEDDLAAQVESQDLSAQSSEAIKDEVDEQKSSEADVSLISESDIIDRVVSRVAKRLLRESKQAKQPARRNIRRRRR